MIANKIKTKKGFTIIEMMIAISIFLVVVIYGMQALLNASLVHKKSQDMRSILDSLSFTLDDMSKNIRTGYNYFCIENDGDLNDANITAGNPKSCKDGIGIAFETSEGNPELPAKDQWVYFISSKKIWKSTEASYCGETCAIQLTPNEIVIDEDASGFSVLGAESPSDGDKQQPLVIMRLVGKINGKNNTFTPFSIETAVSQRLIDLDTTNVIVPPPLGPADSEVSSPVEAPVEAVKATSETTQKASQTQ